MKYNLLVHPGADPGKVKMHYSGKINKLSKDDQGNIAVYTWKPAIL